MGTYYFDTIFNMPLAMSIIYFVESYNNLFLFIIVKMYQHILYVTSSLFTIVFIIKISHTFLMLELSKKVEHKFTIIFYKRYELAF